MGRKEQQLQWLIENMKNIEIIGIHPDGYTGTPTILIEIKNWDVAELAGIDIKDGCIMFE